MTVIREKVVPDGPGGAAATADGEPVTAQRIVLWVAVFAIILTGMNLFAGFYLSQASRDLVGIGDKLDGLSRFEAKITDHVTSSAAALRQRIDNLDTAIDSDLAQLSARVTALEKSLDALQQALGEAEVVAMPDTSQTTSGADAPGPETVGALPKTKPQNPASGGQPSYKRIEGADGKVTYRKVK